MHWYHVAQLVAVALVMAASYRTPRAWTWCLLLAFSGVASFAYLKLAHGAPNMPPAPVANLMLDGMLLLAIANWHREQWEKGLCGIMVFAATAHVIQLYGELVGFPPPFTAVDYALILEALNYLFLALVGGVGLMDRRHAGYDLARARYSLLSLIGSLLHAPSGSRQPLRKW